MADMNITVDGVEELNKFLTDAPREIVASCFLKALKAGGDIIEQTLIYNTPVKEEDTGGILETGELQDSVFLRVELDSQLRGGRAVIGFRGAGPNAVANWIEYGHRIVGHKPRKEYKGKNTTPNPFVRKTADQSAEPALSAFSASLSTSMQEYINQKTGK